MTIDTVAVLDTAPHPTIPPAPAVADLPDEPPPGVAADLLWRVAVRLYRDHGARLIPDDEVGPDEPERCRRCHQPSPCSGRRLAELALKAAAPRPVRLESQTW